MPLVEIKELPTKIPPKSRLLGIDHGEKTLGLALSTPDLLMATPYKTLQRKNFTENIKEIAAICREYEVGGIVFGLPLNMDGTEGSRAQSVRHYAMNLLKEKQSLGFDLYIAFQDERLSTHAVEQLLIEDLNMPRAKRKQVIDAYAAAHILNDALKAMKP